MKIIADKSSMDLGSLLERLRIIAPDIWESRNLKEILPQRMGDLENPEILNDIRWKIQKLDELKDMLERGSISQQDYSSTKIEILSK